jgi:hypothetical protein
MQTILALYASVLALAVWQEDQHWDSAHDVGQVGPVNAPATHA